jgi:hypothetical protein
VEGDKKDAKMPASVSGVPDKKRTGSRKKKGAAAADGQEGAADDLSGESDLERISRDSDLARSGKRVVRAALGGGAGPLATSGVECDFVVVLTRDGCVYTGLLSDNDAAPVASSSARESKDEKKRAAAVLPVLGHGEGKKTAPAGGSSTSAVASPPGTAAHSSAGALPARESWTQLELVHALHPFVLANAAALAAPSANTAAATLAPAAAAPAIGAALTPSQVMVVDVCAGLGHVLALCADGAVFAWGQNEFSQLGLGDRKPRAAPALISALLPSAIKADRARLSAAAAAAAAAGGSGAPPAEEETRDAAGVGDDCASAAAEDDRVVAIACGAFHCVALTSRGEVYSWGRGADGALGHGDTRDREVATLLPLTVAPQTAAAAAAAAANAAAGGKGKAGALSSARGSLSAPSAAAAAASVGVLSEGPPRRVVAIACGSSHSCLLVHRTGSAAAVASADNPLCPYSEVWAFGNNARGALGIQDAQPVPAGASVPSHSQRQQPPASSGESEEICSAPVLVSSLSGLPVLSLVSGGSLSGALLQRWKRGAESETDASSLSDRGSVAANVIRMLDEDEELHTLTPQRTLIP